MLSKTHHGSEFKPLKALNSCMCCKQFDPRLEDILDNQCLVMLSKFAVASRQVIGPVNPAKLIKDDRYSAEIFERVFAHGDEALIVLALEVQSLLSLNTDNGHQPEAQVVSIKSKQATPVQLDTNAASNPPQKYMFGARS